MTTREEFPKHGAASGVCTCGNDMDSEQGLWIEEIQCRGVSADQMIEFLQSEHADSKDPEDREFLQYSIALLERMVHS